MAQYCSYMYMYVQLGFCIQYYCEEVSGYGNCGAQYSEVRISLVNLNKIIHIICWPKHSLFNRHISRILKHMVNAFSIDKL